MSGLRHVEATGVEPAADSGGALALPERLVLFDGECGFCDWAVGFMMARDPEGRLSFAPLQGETAAQIRAAHPGALPDAIETVIYVRSGADSRRFYDESSAAFEIMKELAGPLVRVLGLLRFLPRPVTDAAYRLFARHRIRLFGHADACRLPSPQERARLLD